MTIFDPKTSKLFIPDQGKDHLYNFNRNERLEPERTEILQYLENLWITYETFCPDSHFLTEFPDNLRERWWEMYLANSLINNKLHIEKSVSNGPDIKSNINGSTWIEAVCAGPGNTDDQVPGVIYGQVQHVPTEQILLRLTTVFKKKADKFKKYIDQGIVSPSDKLIIAIDLSGLDLVDIADKEEMPLMCKALLGFGELTMSIPVNLETGEHGETSTFYERREELTKRSGVKIPATNFLSSDYSHISGVITNTQSFVNCPTHGHKFKMLLNPYANNKINKNDFLHFKDIFFEENGYLYNAKKNNRGK